MRRWLTLAILLLAAPAAAQVELFSNNGASTLASGITNSATSITVQTGHGARFPSPSGGDYFFATLIEGSALEIVKCTARATDAMTCTRAQQGTSASAFSVGAKFENRLTKQALQDLQAWRKTSGVLTPATPTDVAAIGASSVATGTRFYVTKNASPTTSNGGESLIYGALFMPDPALDTTGIGAQGYVKNSGSVVGTTAHHIGVLGLAEDTSSGRQTLYGIEGKTEGRGTAGSQEYVGGIFFGNFQGTGFAGSNYGVKAMAKITTDGATPLAQGANIGVYVPPLIGGASKMSFLATDEVNVQRNPATLVSQTTGGADEPLDTAFESVTFTTTGTAINAITIRAKQSGGLTSGTIKGYIYSDSAGSPSVPVSDASTGQPTILNASALGTSYASFTFRVPTSGMTPGGTYHAVFRSESLSGGTVSFERRATGTAMHHVSADVNGDGVPDAWTSENSKELYYAIEENSGQAVYGYSDNQYGALLQSESGFGAYLFSTNGPGGKAQSVHNFGFGCASTYGVGCRGSSVGGFGGQFISDTTAGAQVQTNSPTSVGFQAVANQGAVIQVVSLDPAGKSVSGLNSAFSETWSVTSAGTGTFAGLNVGFAPVVPNGMARPNARRFAYQIPNGSNTTWGQMGDLINGSGTASAVAATTTEPAMMQYITTTTDASNAGTVGNANYVTGRNVRYQSYMRLNATDTVRAWISISTNPFASQAADSPPGDFAGFRYSTSAGDTTWKCATRNNTSTTFVDSGVAASTAGSDFEIAFNDTDGTVSFFIDGASVCSSPVSATLPRSGQMMKVVNTVTCVACATARALQIGWMYVESDK